MTVTSLLPLIAAVLFLIFALSLALGDGSPMKHIWLFPAALSFVFFVFSLYAISIGGPLGFWTEHTRNFWGNQIWFDLLLAVGIGWFFMVPQAKSLGMRPLPWLFLVLSTGSIGFLAMLARLLYLRENVSMRE